MGTKLFFPHYSDSLSTRAGRWHPLLELVLSPLAAAALAAGHQGLPPARRSLRA